MVMSPICTVPATSENAKKRRLPQYLIGRYAHCIRLIYFFFVSIFQPNTTYCNNWANVRSCASVDCPKVSEVKDNSTYPSDCYVIGQRVTEDGNSYFDRWYRLNITTGEYGYVTNLYCSGNVGECEETSTAVHVL